MTPAFRETDVRKFELRRVGATSSAPSSALATTSASGSLKRSAATAEASTTLTAITVGTDQRGRLARGLQTKPTHFSQHFRRRSMLRWSRLFGQFFRFDEWNLCRG